MPARPLRPPTVLPPPIRPGRRGRRSAVRTTLVDLAAPVALYYGLRLVGVDNLAALAAGAAASGLGAVATAIRKRHVDGLGALVLTTMLAGLVGSLVSGGPRELLIRNAYLTAPAGVWTLATLRARRPICFLVTRAMLPHRAEVMDRLWDENPRFRRAWRLITAMWGGIALADAALRVLVAYAMPVDAVPAVDTTVTVATVVLLQLPTHLVLLRSGT